MPDPIPHPPHLTPMLTWLPDAPPGTTIHVESREFAGALVFEGTISGVPEFPAAPIPAPDALSRDHAVGGICLARASLDLSTASRPRAEGGWAIGGEEATGLGCVYQRPRWTDGEWTVEILPLDPRICAVRSGNAIEVRWYGPYRGAGLTHPVGFAVLCARSDSFTEAWRGLAAAYGLPGPHSPEARERVRRVATQPTLFATRPTHHRNADRLLDWVARHGFGSILLHCPIWARSDATYSPNVDNWPGGWDALRAFCDRARSFGVVIGLHTMTTSVAGHDPLVTPVPDRRLLSLWSSTLRRGVDRDQTTLLLDDPIDGLSLRQDYMSYGRVFRLDDELVLYSAIDADANALIGCQRGAYGTRPTSHAAGCPAHYLFRVYDEFAVDPESDLADEVAANLGRAFAATGAEMIYFDDSEAVPDPYLGHVSAYHAKVWRAIGLPHLHVQASSTGPFGQFLLARIGQQDTTIYKRPLLDGRILPAVPAYQAADLVPDFGWFGVVQGDLDRLPTSRDDIDCLMARVTGCTAGVTLFGKPDSTGSSLFTTVARRIGEWRSAAIPESVRPRLAVAGTEFRLRPEEGRAVAHEVQPWRGRLTVDGAGSIAIPIRHDGAATPLPLRMTVYPRISAPGSPENVPLYLPERDPVIDLTASASHDGSSWRWAITDPERDFSRWRVTFPTRLDLSSHRALSVRFRVIGEADHVVIRLLQDLDGWPHGVECTLPFQAREECVVIDPQPEPALHLKGRWPDEWFCYTLGIDYSRVEAVEIAAVGLRPRQDDEGAIIVHGIEACREHRITGAWNPTAECVPAATSAEGRLHPKLMIGTPLSDQATLELTPIEGGGLRAEVFSLAGAVEWSWDYDPEEAPTLRPGENLVRIGGLPPGARVDVRVDRALHGPAS